MLGLHKFNKDENDMEYLMRKNMLLAMKKQQQKLVYGDDEITPAEQLHMKTVQYEQIKS